uniref:Uncharacterized protein n=1 Tax=Tanacetum cinerariifolium TaxID=118510 RepID=A0A6L2M8V3_TANCI|nr:hypothetical protein [Tanacetum cinerariifolium]
MFIIRAAYKIGAHVISSNAIEQAIFKFCTPQIEKPFDSSLLFFCNSHRKPCFNGWKENFKKWRKELQNHEKWRKRITVMHLDLSSFDSIRQLVGEIKQSGFGERKAELDFQGLWFYFLTSLLMFSEHWAEKLKISLKVEAESSIKFSLYPTGVVHMLHLTS